ncbi:MAG: LysM peptidoglycan-binding domain-containing protein, partial [Clostridiales bacterium]|nr:LysM peptidoglycan-binding domain-containing protein [Clostridiales bacterium]
MKRITSLVLTLTLILASVVSAYAATYTVKRGDTLSGIAAEFDTTYQEIARVNGVANPNIIQIGQVLTIPDKSEAVAPVATPIPSSTMAPAAPTATPALQPVPDVNYDDIKGTELVIATTTSTNDTGLLDVLVPAFDKKYGTTSKWVSVGSGEAMEMGKRGDADILLVHSRA